jgi:2-polyprenyl-3-methyl-5-hydroxy-6-metoxy-1,4-benzoquinol methylase
MTRRFGSDLTDKPARAAAAAGGERIPLLTSVLTSSEVSGATGRKPYSQDAKPDDRRVDYGGRTSIICSMLPAHSSRLLDIGCGPVNANYTFARKAAQVTCVDANFIPLSGMPPNVDFISADINNIAIISETYDCVVAADVFEHISLEQESRFVCQCVSALKPGGILVLSVPHQGTFSFLDPFQVKPALHRMLARLHLYNHIHNGHCDIRKGHKHYSIEELVAAFQVLQLKEVVYFGYLFDPLVSWAIALSGAPGRMPGFCFLEKGRRNELRRDYGRRSFNVAASFVKHS